MALDHSTAATALLAWVDTWTEAKWEGSASDLLGKLTERVHGVVLAGNAFPKAPNRLSGELRRIAPALRRIGVKVELGRSRHGSKIMIERTGDFAQCALVKREPAASPDGSPTLSSLTGGRVPFNLPYEVKEWPNGSATVCFPHLTEDQVLRLDPVARTELAVGKDGRNSMSIRRPKVLAG
ncbi:MAG: hypothetical protein FJ271_28885 [Planctomycetes bacterium]|nr:hypothetical protein [Planctomycetota bacterium]